MLSKKLSGIAAGLIASAAMADVTPGTHQAPVASKIVKPKIVSITQLSTGQLVVPSNNGGGVALGNGAIYDTMTCESCPEGLNVPYVGDPIGTVDCDCYTVGCENNQAYVVPLSPGACPLAGGGLPAPDANDILFDDYLAEGEGTAELGTVEFVVALSNFNPHPDQTDTNVTLLVLFFDDQGLEFLDGFQLTFGLPADGSGDGFGPVEVDLSELAPFVVNRSGLVMFDWINDETDEAGVPIGPEVCGLGVVAMGGDILDAACGEPIVTAGTNDLVTWLFADANEGDIDENFDGEEGLSYIDILNTGEIINVGFVDDIREPTSELPHGVALRLSEGVPGCPVAGCDTDLDGDCAVGLGDLGALLSCYNQPAACNPAADFDDDGTIGLGDLGALLAQYNNNCN